MPKPHKDTPPPTISDAEIEQRASSGEKYKNLGKYTEAAAMYNSAVEVHGTHSVYMSNLAATYLKLEDYELAEKAATMALTHDPRMVKARFRRGLARKGKNQLRAACTDFTTILREVDPSCAEAKAELKIVLPWIDRGDDEESGIWDDWEYPTPDHPPRAPLPLYLINNSDPSGPDSEDEVLGHVGNGIPCKHHNLKPLGCAKGESCAYSHAPDARSMPDSEGRNVCLYLLMGSCKFGDRCLYSHSKANLPEFWGDETRLPHVRELIRANELAIRERRLFSKYMGKGPLASDLMLAMKHITDEKKRARQVADFIAKFDALDRALTTPPFIMHLTLNKTTNIPGAIVSALRDVVEVSRAKSKTKAMSMLSSAGLAGIFITDAGIIEDKNTALLAKIVAYAKDGGTVVIGGSFKTLDGNKQANITPAQLESFFKSGWGLSWRMGCQRATERKTFSLNQNMNLEAPMALPDSYSMTAMHLKGVRADAALYLPTGHCQLDSAASRADSLVETPVVFTEFGGGRLGFVGDSGGGRESADVIMSMFRLPMHSQA
ncbi:hypothetical protein C8R47DRAFT_174848 [Mycena vitilis]|nr:hypothetical protein C8R47DRAFT_174848 [Mycena vitilis]